MPARTILSSTLFPTLKTLKFQRTGQVLYQVDEDDNSIRLHFQKDSGPGAVYFVNIEYRPAVWMEFQRDQGRDTPDFTMGLVFGRITHGGGRDAWDLGDDEEGRAAAGYLLKRIRDDYLPFLETLKDLDLLIQFINAGQQIGPPSFALQTIRPHVAKTLLLSARGPSPELEKALSLFDENPTGHLSRWLIQRLRAGGQPEQ